MTVRYHGSAMIVGRVWHIECDAEAMIRLKRVFPRADALALGQLSIRRSPEVDLDLQWFSDRYALEMSADDLDHLHAGAERARHQARRVVEMLEPNYAPGTFDLAMEARPYQRTAADLWLASGGLLLADALGLGKTVSAIAGLSDPRTRPGVIVCPVHLMAQWADELLKFLPGVAVHIVEGTTPYGIPERAQRLARRKREKWPMTADGDPAWPDFVIVSYSRLPGWATTLAPRSKSVVYDEVQELHRAKDGEEYTQKYAGALCVSNAVDFRLGLSATPVQNYGGEAFNVLEALRPGRLGTREEFRREWTSGGEERKTMIANPKAFGLFLHRTGAMLRRTRKDVGRELPPMQTIVHSFDVDEKAFARLTSGSAELARIILAQSAGNRSGLMKRDASAELERIERQATGICKAPLIAAFLRMIVESDEPVVCALWHREVYALIMEALHDLAPVMYTGSESPKQKTAAITAFRKRESPIMLMSLRSGAGINGIESVCRTMVIGELDWSPKVHEQFFGRSNRERQAEQLAVTGYYLLARSGSDPTVAQVLDIKNSQSVPIVDPNAPIVAGTADPEHIKRLAQAVLARSRR